MFLRQTRRKKDGKTHTYWSVVENQRLQGGRVVQRHVLYLGEISPSQAAAWRKSIEVFDEEAGQARTLALFPEDRCAAAAPDTSVVQLRLSESLFESIISAGYAATRLSILPSAEVRSRKAPVWCLPNACLHRSGASLPPNLFY